MDGEITIGTTLSTDKFDRQIAQLEKKMQKEEEKKIVLDAKIKIQEEDFERARQKTDELADAYQRLEQLQKAISSGKATPQQFTMAQELQRTYGSLDQLELSFLKALNKQDAINEKTYEMRTKYQEINDKVAEYKQKIENIKLEKHINDVEQIKGSFSSVGSTMERIIGQAGRLVIGIFGIRSAFLAVRQAVSLLSQYNEGLAKQIQAIKLALVSIIEPVVNFIVNLIGKAVSFVAYILKKLFGIDIFARATAISFSKMNKSAVGTTKAVKELKKQLAGFDEINMLNQDGTTGIANAIGGGLGGTKDNINDVSKELEDLNTQGEQVAANLRKWFLGSDKTDIKGIWQDNVKTITGFIKDIKTAFTPLAKWIYDNAWIPIKNYLKQTMKDLEPIIKPIKTAFSNAIKDIKPYWVSFKNYVKEKIITPIINALKPIGKKFYEALVPYINKAIRAMNTILKPLGLELKEINAKKSAGGGFRAKGGVFYPSLIPKLAVGGIINQPRKRNNV